MDPRVRELMRGLVPDVPWGGDVTTGERAVTGDLKVDT